MADLNMFIPLTKVDAEKRLVYGVATAEAPDRAGEICDYASTKPFYEKWSADFERASGGKSLGNLRAMHGKVAAGRLRKIAFNDAAKQIEICAHIVDDAEWRKVQAGVYTGFSQGGAYVKRWTDADDPALTRYTADPAEISLVDLPCLPDATFEMVKANGFREQIRFQLADSGVQQVWRTADGATFVKKADALAHGAAAPRREIPESRRPKAGSLMCKDFGDVAGLALLLEQLDWLRQTFAAAQAPNDQDASTLAHLGDSVAALTAGLVALAEAETRVLSSDDDDALLVNVAARPRAKNEALLKFLQDRADFAPLAARLAKCDAEDVQKAETTDKDDDTLASKLAKAQADMAAKLNKLAERIEEIGRQPAPAPMSPGARAVEKNNETGEDPDIALAKHLAGLSERQKALLMIKAQQTAPLSFGA